MIVPQIDVGEDLLARVGIGHSLTHSETPLWLRKTHESIEDQIRSRMRAFVSSPAPKVKITLPAFDYDRALDQLTSEKSVNPINVKATERLGADTLSAYQVAVNRAIGFLAAELPKSTITTLASTRNVRPSDLTIGGFRRFYQIAEDPMSVIDAMVKGILTPDQVRALQAMFPTFYEAAKVLFKEAVDEKLAGNPEWYLPYSREQIALMFMQIKPGDAEALKTLQQNFANAKERAAVQQKDAPDPAPPGRGLAKSVETPVQRASQ